MGVIRFFLLSIFVARIGGGQPEVNVMLRRVELGIGVNVTLEDVAPTGSWFLHAAKVSGTVLTI